MPCFLVDCVVEPLNPFLYKVIIKLYFISDDGRQAAVAELRWADNLENVKEGIISFRGGFEVSVII